MNGLTELLLALLSGPGLAAVISVVAATLAMLGIERTISSQLIEIARSLLTGKGLASKASEPSYGEKIATLVESLAKASTEVDHILAEMRTTVSSRETAIAGLESKLGQLSAREQELKTSITTLEQVPLPAVEFFLRTTAKNEQRSVVRDTLFFIGGIILTTIITVILKVFFQI